MVLALGSNVIAGNSEELNIAKIINIIYPIGSLYITENNINPSEQFGVGEWIKVSSGRVLQGSDDTHKSGTTVEAGLPNITGGFCDLLSSAGVSSAGYTTMGNGGGAFYVPWLKENDCATIRQAKIDGTNLAYACSTDDGIGFNASLSNPIYGKSDTVQPPAYFVNIWKRIS